MLNFRQYMELEKKVARELDQWLDDDDNKLSFDNLFGENYRIVVPYITPELQKVVQEIENLKDPKTGEPKNYKVDLNRNTVVQQGKTLEGKPFKREIRIGKVIQQELGPDAQSYWNKAGGQSKAEGYSIVVSRHPIDIVRMSDHGWWSCHAPSGSYWQCAVDEAKGHGPVAYLVKTRDLANIPKGDLEGREEIFQDGDRGISGIKPVARIRLRRFYNKKHEYELAVPEDRVYPGNSSFAYNLKHSIRQWAKTAQAELIAKGPPVLKDFVRTGGSYADNSASVLFNNFFNVSHYKGDAEFEGNGGGSLADQYEEELEQMRQRAKFENPIDAYAEVEDDGDGHPYVYCGGSVYMDFPVSDFHNVERLAKYDSEDWDHRRAVKTAIEDAIGDLKANLYGISEVDFQLSRSESKVQIRFSIDVESDNNGPDQFRDLVDHLKDWDKHYRAAYTAVRNALESLGEVRPHPINKVIDAPHDFRHFKMEQDGGVYEFASDPVVIGNYKGLEGHPEGESYYDRSIKADQPNFVALRNGMLQFINKGLATIRQRDRQQMMLPGFRRSPNYQRPLRDEPEVKFTTDYDSNVLMQIVVPLHAMMDFRSSNIAAAYVRYLDNNFPQIVQQAAQMYQFMVRAHYQKPQAAGQPQA